MIFGGAEVLLYFGCMLTSTYFTIVCVMSRRPPPVNVNNTRNSTQSEPLTVASFAERSLHITPLLHKDRRSRTRESRYYQSDSINLNEADLNGSKLGNEPDLIESPSSNSSPPLSIMYEDVTIFSDSESDSQKLVIKEELLRQARLLKKKKRMNHNNPKV